MPCTATLSAPRDDFREAKKGGPAMIPTFPGSSVPRAKMTVTSLQPMLAVMSFSVKRPEAEDEVAVSVAAMEEYAEVSAAELRSVLVAVVSAPVVAAAETAAEETAALVVEADPKIPN